MSAVVLPTAKITGRADPRADADVLEKLKARFGGKLVSSEIVRRQLVKVMIDRADLVELCRFLKDDLGFAHLGCISAVDWKDHFESVYHIENYATGSVVQVNARIPHDDPKIASVCSVWNAANFHEREAWDLMGIVYEGHPDLRRILLPDDFKFHPLRKDFPQEVDRQYISRRKLKGGK
jgi:NADH/F420H2 dehydrogenase subunit C